MRIAVNTRLLINSKLDGIGWFTAETMRIIVGNHPDVEFIFFFDRKPDPHFIFGPNVTPVVLCPQARHPLLWYAYFQWSVASALRRYHPDLYLTPDGYMPLPCTTPTLAVVHDLNFEHDDSYLRPSHQRYMKRYFPRFAHGASRLATVSEYSKADIAATYGIDSEAIDVVYNGANSHYTPRTAAQQEATRLRLTAGQPFFLFVSTILKRKNLHGLLRAFDLYKERTAAPDKLVVVGNRAWWQEPLRSTYETMRHRADVVFIGHADVGYLADIMAAARALVYPSFFEGFGIPIIEAFSAGTPVITSNVTSMPEIAADAALLIDPHSPQSIADAMQLATQPEVAANLVAKGHKQVAHYSWERTANLLWQSMMKVLDRQ
ncbi:MAG: glycosyltransferase family 4 protein [Bacteroidales bacterium]|nr:glycosyltransferase family 4 protein [Bacteroidales bacterium]